MFTVQTLLLSYCIFTITIIFNNKVECPACIHCLNKIEDPSLQSLCVYIKAEYWLWFFIKISASASKIQNHSGSNQKSEMSHLIWYLTTSAGNSTAKTHLPYYHHLLCVYVVPEWSGFVLHLQCLDLSLCLWLTFSLGLRGSPYYRGGAAAPYSGQSCDTRSQPLRGTPGQTDSERNVERHTEHSYIHVPHSCSEQRDSRFLFQPNTVADFTDLLFTLNIYNPAAVELKQNLCNKSVHKYNNLPGWWCRTWWAIGTFTGSKESPKTPGNLGLSTTADLSKVTSCLGLEIWGIPTHLLPFLALPCRKAQLGQVLAQSASPAHHSSPSLLDRLWFKKQKHVSSVRSHTLKCLQQMKNPTDDYLSCLLSKAFLLNTRRW